MKNTHELAADLRRHARKIGTLAGDTPSVMTMAADRLDATASELAALKAPPAPGDVRAALAGYAEWTGSPPVLTDAVELIDQQAQRIADLETKCVTLKRLHDAATDERDALRARLAEIEAQEPVAVICSGYGIHYAGAEPISAVVARHGLKVGSALYARPVPAQAVPMSDKQRKEITLNAAQLRNALEFIAPDFDSDADQHKSEVTICWREAGTVVDDDGKPEPAGYVAWLSDYPEEGCIPLLESFESKPAPTQAVPTGPRQAVQLTDEQIARAYCKALGVEYLLPTDEDADQEAYSALMRVGGAIQALVLAANGLEAAR